MRRGLLALAVLLLTGWASVAQAQLTPVFTFTELTTISPDEVNTNFALFSSALNRTGGTMTGTLTSRAIVPSANDTYAIGETGTRFSNIFGVLGNFSGNVTVATLNTFTFNQSVASGGTPTFTGTNFTGIPEAGITDGSILARVGGAETISGAWSFSSTLTAAGPVLVTSVISPTALAANTNNYAPTGFNTATVLRLTSDGPYEITGLAGGSAGRVVYLVNANADPTTNGFTLTAEDASSSAANRFANSNVLQTIMLRCWYDGTSSRWRCM